MKNADEDHRKPLWFKLPLVLLALFAVFIGFQLSFYQPDQPIPTIVPQFSSGPAFAVQIIRPRVGLPFGGILPPELFGLDDHLGFDSSSSGATVRDVSPHRIELAADDWYLLLVLDDNGKVTSKSEIVFKMVFEERVQMVRGRPGDPVVGMANIVKSTESGEIAGSFDIEIPNCEYANTGKPLGWPASPLVLHGSFDRLSLAAENERH